MVDWIIEVLSAYSYGPETFFLAVNVLDNYFAKSEKSIPADDLHLIGVASIYLAVKFEEVCALRLKTVYEEVAHKKILKSKILEKETDILNTIGFTLIYQDIFFYYQS